MDFPAGGALLETVTHSPNPHLEYQASRGDSSDELQRPDYLQLILTARVYDVIEQTPLQQAHNLSSRLGATVLMKREDLLPVFSFKIRGAYNRMVNLSDEEKAAGVIACSAGNHAQGVAMAAKHLGIKAVIVMPLATPRIKWQNVKRLGGEVVLYGDDFDAAKQECARLADLHGYTNIPPFDHPYIIAGQGTIGVEILRQWNLNDIRAIFCCVGGGGLIAGIGSYVKRIAPHIKIIGVETVDANAMTVSLEGKSRQELKEVGLFADGAAVRLVGEECFKLAMEFVDEMIEVTNDEICAAIKDVFEDTRSITEPAGALSMAGLKKYLQLHPEEKGKGAFVSVLSGANMNFDRLRFVAERAELGEHTEAFMSVIIPERPGSFMKMLDHIIDRGAITEFSYRYGDPEKAYIYTSFKVSHVEKDVPQVIKALQEDGMEAWDLSDNEMAKTHARYMVGGRSSVENERLFRFEFPERPGALAKFLRGMQTGWNVSLFHYRNHGDDMGKALVGIQVPPEDKDSFAAFLRDLNYAWVEETDNFVYKIFLNAFRAATFCNHGQPRLDHDVIATMENMHPFNFVGHPNYQQPYPGQQLPPQGEPHPLMMSQAYVGYPQHAYGSPHPMPPQSYPQQAYASPIPQQYTHHPPQPHYEIPANFAPKQYRPPGGYPMPPGYQMNGHGHPYPPRSMPPLPQQYQFRIQEPIRAAPGQAAGFRMINRTDSAPTPTRRAPKRSAAKKKYDDEEEDDIDEILDALSDPSDEFSESDDFSDTSSRRKKGKRKGGSSTRGTATPQEDAEEDEGPVVIPMGSYEFERILNWRQNPEQGNREELLVKYKHMSFHNARWVSRKELEAEHLGKNRVKRYMQRFHADGNQGEDFSEALKIDRIIDEGEAPDPDNGEPVVYYLVKWNTLPYENSTWDKAEDVEALDADKIEEFHKRREIPVAKERYYPRPQPFSFTSLTESPKFKYGNELRSYQLEGLNWLMFCYYNYRSSILADEMGLGKTVQSVAFLNELYYKLNIRGPFLVVAPLSTIPHWERAFLAWTGMNVVDYRGSTTSRELIVETEFFYKDADGNPIPNMCKFDVVITTYEMAQAGQDDLRPIPWRVAIFDEAHRLKNTKSKVVDVLRQFSIEHKLLLTGTPIQNNVEELYSLLSFMQPDRFNDEQGFIREYGNLRTSAEVEKLQALLKPIMLRRFKEDVEKTIPVKEETVIEVELTAAQKRWYRAILEKNFSFLRKGQKTNKQVPQLNNIMMQLRKCCIHPYLLQGAEEVITHERHARTPEDYFNCLIQSSGKLVLIDKLLKKLMDGGHKVLIFSQFTTCLDILSDYLKGRRYAHERIDGGVRGDLRQAAIDRFNTMPIPQAFVFLLCTRAGGVGINLTAADTCIIFDSDWNPQNDLQAQARCHRIGQTKAVQIYRLICRNTYEKEMFDRAGMKLGLDQAVMQKMDVNSSMNDDEATAPSRSGLSKKAIEDLLKKGAYGAMLDEEASDNFVAEDIDQILERRSRVITHEGNDKGNVFSKATFAASADNDIELDDPDFWDKWAEKAAIDTSLDDDHNLIMYQPRQRRQVQKFGIKPDGDNYSELSDDDDTDTFGGQDKSKRRGEVTQLWTISEKTRYERRLMMFGYGRWDQMSPYFSRRSEKDLKAVTRALIRLIWHTAETGTEEDRKLVQDISNAMADDPDEDPNDLTIPYVGANKRQIAEYRSFLINAGPEYADHLVRKGRNILLRIQMLYLIRDKIVPSDWEEAKALQVPKIAGQPPADWWGPDEDRDLLLSICKYGYQQYTLMRNDPEFCFYGRHFDDSAAGNLDEDEPAPAKQGKAQKSGNALKEETEEETEQTASSDENGSAIKPEETSTVNEGLTDDSQDMKPTKMELGEPAKSGIELENDSHESAKDAADAEAKPEGSDSLQKTDGEQLSEEMSVDEEKEAGENGEAILLWPSKADIGIRLRRVIAAFQRQEALQSRKMKSAQKEKQKEQLRVERQRQKEIRLAERQRQKVQDASNRWSKKNRSDFFRVITSFGVETHPGDPKIYWDRFKDLANLTSKTDESMDAYYDDMMLAAEEAVQRAGKSKTDKAKEKEEESLDHSASRNGSPDNAAYSPPPEANGEGDGDVDDERDEVMALDKAKRILKRVEQMKVIREQVLTSADLESNLSVARKTSGLPQWWMVPEHDVAFLQAICRHGYNRHDLIIQDEEFPFKSIRDSLIQRIKEEEPELEEEQLIAKADEEFAFPKDLVINRRVQTLTDLVLHPKPISKKRAAQARRMAEKYGGSAGDAPKTKRPSSRRNENALKIKLKLPHKNHDFDESTEQSMMEDLDSGDDTDDILNAASERMKMHRDIDRKHHYRHGHSHHRDSSHHHHVPHPLHPLAPEHTGHGHKRAREYGSDDDLSSSDITDSEMSTTTSAAFTPTKKQKVPDTDMPVE